MSVTSHFVREEFSTEKDSTVATYNPLVEYPNYALYYVSTMFVNVQQLKKDISAEHQYEKHELFRLNDCLRLFIDRVQQLEQQNAKYMTILADFRRQSSNVSVVSAEWSEHSHLQADLMTLNFRKFDYELEFELFQMQSEIYKQLIYMVDQQSNDQRLKLQHELDRSSTELIDLRTSFGSVEKKLTGLHAEREDIFQQYLKMAANWGHWQKETRELKFSIQALKKQQLFYKNVQSHMTSDSIVTEAFDVKKFWAMKWEKMIASIRHDYELLYAAAHRETVVYYEKKMEEVQEEVKQAIIVQTNFCQEFGMKQFEIALQTLQVEYEESQKMYAYEEEIYLKLEATHSKIESEYESIQLQLTERFEEQSQNLIVLQETVVTMVENIEAMRRKKISLESELIVYRHLLELDEIQSTVVINTSTSHRSTTMKKYVVERQERASVGIECPIDNTYVCLINHSKVKEIDISGWILKRRTDSRVEVKYTLPDKIRLPIGSELRIYSKLGAETAQLSSNYDDISHPSRLKVVSNTVVAWITGDKIETLLYNEHGEEKASCIQTAASEEGIID